MKKVMGVVSFFVLAGSLLVSCNDDDAANGSNGENPTIAEAKGIYKSMENADGLFRITLSGTDMDFHLNFISDQIAESELLNAEMKSETYTISDVGTKYSLQTDSYLKDGTLQTGLVSGSLVVERNNENYKIEGVITDANKVSYTINFNGFIDIEPEYDVVYEKQNGWYWGDNEYDYPNIAEYMSYFAQGPTDNYGELSGDGYYVNLSFFNAMAPKAWEAQIPNATYTASTAYEEGTFHIASAEDIADDAPYYAFSYFRQVNAAAGIDKEQFITGGTVRVTEKDNGQELRFNLLLEDGTWHVSKYVGNVRQGDEYTVTTLVNDVEVAPFNHGYIEYKGQSPIAGSDNKRWNLYLASPNVTLYPEYYWAAEGTGEYMRITLYSDGAAGMTLAEGTYPLGNEVAGNAGAGAGYEVGLDFGTWYYQMEADEYANYAPVKTGTIVVAKEGANYTITMNGKDDRDNTITASYSGPLTAVDNGNGNKKSQNLKKKKNTKETPVTNSYSYKKKRRTY